MSNGFEITDNELIELKNEVKNVTGYELNQIVITSFSNNHIEYDIYNDSLSDLINKNDPIRSGRYVKGIC